MPIVAEQYSYVIGVDTHARTHTYAVIETITGRLIGHATFPASPPGIRRAVGWITRVAPGEVLAAVEGTSSYGAGLHAVLRGAGIPVVEVHAPKRADRQHGKSDAIDAEAAARSVLGMDVVLLAAPRQGQIRSALRVLLTARKAMDTQRTADRNALTALLRTIAFDIDVRRPLTDRHVEVIAGWRTHPTDDVEHAVARAEATRLARHVISLTGELARNRAALQHHVTTLAPALLDEKGIGPISAAVFLTAWSHPERFRSEAAFAALAGTAPIPASSGNTTRHRLNKRGDRRLNSALDTVARTRMTHDPATRSYLARRTAEGKTPREIRRILKRYIARHIHRTLKATMLTT